MGGQISTLGDIFSYGILLLEMFTGKKPIDEMFIDGLSIHRFTSIALPEHVMDIVDPTMFYEEDEEDVDERNEDDIEDRAIIEEEPHLNVCSRIKDCLISIFEIGLSCSTTSPNERMPTNVVVTEMNAIRDTYLNLRRETGEESTRYVNSFHFILKKISFHFINVHTYFSLFCERKITI